jgi:hypothetical protein
MGLFGFLKKKETLLQPAKPEGLQSSLDPLSDLPPIDGSDLPPLSDMPSTLEPPESPADTNSIAPQAGVSVNIPP